MFFFAFFGIQDREERLGACPNVVCPECGRLTRFDVYKYYKYLHIFFIPTFRWDTRYLVRTPCCGALYELDPEIGRAFERNPNTEIRPERLRRLNAASPYKYCPTCQVTVPPDFEYCPYCGGKLQPGP